ncbi:hypothetical protein SFRURICE_011817 [Spodoptera frugiperda]|nr:hypothetical protein SFRURICE_011817 [Spodoptera frugiperda]
MADRLPYSVRVLLESCVRNCDGFQVLQKDVQNVLEWETNQAVEGGVEIAFKPARVILQDLTGVPAVVDFAAMRDAVKDLGGDPQKINPICPADLVIDHSVQVDFARRNKERFQFLKWGAQAFDNMLIVPPGSGIVHQVNLEYLARVVFSKDLLHPDSVVGTDSHTTMINGLGVVGWGVGANMCPEFGATVAHFPVDERSLHYLCQTSELEFFVKSSLESLHLAGFTNMCPEFGATVAHFPVDERSLHYLCQTSELEFFVKSSLESYMKRPPIQFADRSQEKIAIIEAYLRATKQFRDYNNPDQDPIFSEVVELDLSTVVTSVSGPKRPQDRVSVSIMKKDFQECLTNKVGTILNVTSVSGIEF